MKPDTSLKNLSRKDLVDLLILEKKKNEILKQKLFEANKKLEEQKHTFQNAGSLADAAVQISGVLEAAQKAADIYLRNIRGSNEETDKSE